MTVFPQVQLEQIAGDFVDREDVGIAAVAPSDCTTDHCVSESIGAVIGAGLYGALIGWGVDALVKGRTTVFRSDAAPGLSVTPRSGGLSARAVFSW